MPSRTSDEREQRRGLVLGLTLAEVLLLLLFLLLLALAGKLQQLKKEAEQANARVVLVGNQLKPLQEALLAHGAADIAGVQQLVERFQRMSVIEDEIVRLRKDNADLALTSQLTKTISKSGLEDFAEAMRRASRIDPTDPPALIKRAVDVLERLGSATRPEDVRPLSELLSVQDSATKAVDAARMISALQADRDKLQRDVSNLMRSGNGLTYPSCWSTGSGQTEFIFDITFADEGIVVNDATPGRAQDAAWKMVEPFPRGQQINEQTLINTTAKLFAWSKQQNCRFYTVNRDATGDTNKSRYKLLQRTIERHFYPFYAGPAASPSRPGGRSPKPPLPLSATQATAPARTQLSVDGPSRN